MAAAFRPVNSPLANPSRAKTSWLRRPLPLDPTQRLTRIPQDLSTMVRLRPERLSMFPWLARSRSPPARSRRACRYPIQHLNRGCLERHNSRHSNKSADSGDVEMDDSDGETGTIEEGQASDEESVGAEGTRSSKKKKSQRFYCTDYPPCNLSFTRSEHLARHIRVRQLVFCF
ncbi:Up in starvation [Fusarium falciforme]|nr:Up in starvation [Fusarium falciforme]